MWGAGSKKIFDLCGWAVKTCTNACTVGASIQPRQELVIIRNWWGIPFPVQIGDCKLGGIELKERSAIKLTLGIYVAASTVTIIAENVIKVCAL